MFRAQDRLTNATRPRDCKQKFFRHSQLGAELDFSLQTFGDSRLVIRLNEGIADEGEGVEDVYLHRFEQIGVDDVIGTSLVIGIVAVIARDGVRVVARVIHHGLLLLLLFGWIQMMLCSRWSWNVCGYIRRAVLEISERKQWLLQGNGGALI